MAVSKSDRRIKIKRGIRKKISGTSDRPRLSIFRSNTGIYAQIIDDVKQVTLASASSKDIDPKSKSANIETAITVGKLLAEKAKAQGISAIVFDRNGYLYHGKVKAFAESLRNNGLIF
jgi:large subunit ribosomal protein L18